VGKFFDFHILNFEKFVSILTPQNLHFLKMIIQIQTVSGKKHQIDIQPNATIGSIKEELEQREGISGAQQRILFHGQPLKDEITLEVAKIGPGATLHMVLALRAGQ
jgi:hypothetical protein